MHRGQRGCGDAPNAVATSLNGVDTSVDMEDLAGGHGKQIAQERDASPCHDVRVVNIPAEEDAGGPGVLEGGEAGDRLGGHGADWAGGHQIDPDAVGTEFLGQVAGEGLEGRLGYARRVVERPSHRGVEVEADDRSAPVVARLREEGPALQPGPDSV